ncbi:lytic transglycosylase domain-containing protein [Taibaiella soli]|nr:lytic transglycosylase domain-containing protein [Taibaiella soli]
MKRTISVLGINFLSGVFIAHSFPTLQDSVRIQKVNPADSTLRALHNSVPAAQQKEIAGCISQFGRYYQNIRSSKGQYLDFISSLLIKYNLPDELKLIAVIESHLETTCTSEAGAAGIWQLMPDIARDNNLALAPIDDRQDVYKSSFVALKLVTELYKRFKNDLLVVAAYNCGPGRVNSAITQAKSTDYWAVHAYLPKETQFHIIKYLAASTVFYNLPCGKYLALKQEGDAFRLPVKKKSERYATIQITSSFRETAILKYLHTDAASFRKLNPQLNTTLDRSGQYQLKLSDADMLVFLSKKYDILKASITDQP